MQDALQNGYGVQYWGPDFNADTLNDTSHGLLIMEAAKVGALDTSDGKERFFTPAEIQTIGQDGSRPVLVYLNLTEVEPWRDYWPSDRSIPSWVGPVTAHGDKLAAFWQPEWRGILHERVERLLATGADGLFLDDVLNYFVAGSLVSGLPDTPRSIEMSAAVMLNLVKEIASKAREIRCDALIVVNNGVFIGRDAPASARDDFDAYRDAIDGIMIEDGFGAADHPDLHAALTQDYLNRGISVLSLDFASNDQAKIIAQKARDRGYAPYIVPDGSFSYLAPPASHYR
ncbi:endo alpha-1,4 polygalactosaminidase [Marivita sp. S0852]|uniref:endo alpha-1,4 polygalactosaminidase n=1 Tax=Marivita sp. S0852 TaxID=3373893 RepID=UPI003982A426